MNQMMYLVIAWGIFCIGGIIYFGWIKEDE